MCKRSAGFLAILLAVGWAPAVRAQLQAPLPSPNATVSQTVGVTKVEVVYSRPHVKGPTRVAVVYRMDIWRVSCEGRDCGRLLAGMVEKGEEHESGSSPRR